MNKIAVLDLETCDLESTCVVLSLALLFVNIDDIKYSIEDMYNDTFFIKFDASEQVKTYGRTTNKDTLSWWSTQAKAVRQKSLIPSNSDVSLEDGLKACLYFAKRFSAKDTIPVFTRSPISQVALTSICKAVGMDSIFPFYNFRDVKTFLECMNTNAKKGYCAIDKNLFPDYNRNDLVSHDPQSDCVADAAMLITSINS